MKTSRKTVAMMGALIVFVLLVSILSMMVRSNRSIAPPVQLPQASHPPPVPETETAPQAGGNPDALLPSSGTPVRKLPPRTPLSLPADPLVSPRIAPLVGADAASYLARMDALRTTDRALQQSEIAAIYRFLDVHRSPQALNAEEYHALRNELLNLLRDQEPFPIHLASNLMIMYRDRNHDPVWRDYCIQHLAQIYSDVDPAHQDAVRATIWEATDETGSTIAGTALIGLARNIEHPGFNRDQIARKALLYAADHAMDDMTRLTSIQVCALLEEEKVLPTARELADSSGAATLRMSAIAAIGTLGGPADRDLLNRYARATDVRLRTAALSALERLPDGG